MINDRNIRSLIRSTVHYMPWQDRPIGLDIDVHYGVITLTAGGREVKVPPSEYMPYSRNCVKWIDLIRSKVISLFSKFSPDPVMGVSKPLFDVMTQVQEVTI